MTQKHDGGPAFAHGNPQDGGDPGMSKREWFAGQNAPRFFDHNMAEGHTVEESANIAAKWSYTLADAMLAAGAQSATSDPLRDAAPDMLEALKFARSYIGMQAGSDPNAFAYLDRVDAAIAREEGGDA